ncbi:MAG: lipoprotein-releasing ABC transporter permease subunit [Rhodospirillaceae bacterium]|nr:MAG: lipoprotein-releasing ABC transporter permease subunit [Rhodospirillaceae bacterium]
MIFGPFERMVAARYLRARRKEGFVSVIVGFSFVGIALGVATLIIVMAVMNGFRQDIFDRILGFNGHIDVSANVALSDFDNLSARIRSIPGVVSVMPVVEGEVMITSDRNAGGALVRGVRGEDLAQHPWIAGHILEGSLDTLSKGDGVLIGTGLAQNFGVRSGGQLTMISPKGNVTAFGTVPRQGTFPVSGVFNIGESQFDTGVVFMPLERAQIYFKYPNAVTNLEVWVDNPDKARDIAAEISNANPNLRVLSWETIQGPLYNALGVERVVMFLILTLIILVAALNIVSGLIMLVKDKGSDIAILRTMGATRGMIMRIFLLTGATVGTVGTTLGFGIGCVFCDNIESIRQFLQRLTGTNLFSPEVYFLSQIPAKMEWGENLLIVAMSLALSFAATLYPSWRAARTDPVEALRYE